MFMIVFLANITFFKAKTIFSTSKMAHHWPKAALAHHSICFYQITYKAISL